MPETHKAALLTLTPPELRAELRAEIERLGSLSPHDELFRLCRILLLHDRLVGELPAAINSGAERLEAILLTVAAAEKNLAALLGDAAGRDADAAVREVRARFNTLQKNLVAKLEAELTLAGTQKIQAATAALGDALELFKTSQTGLQTAAYRAEQTAVYLAELGERQRRVSVWLWLATGVMIGVMVSAGVCALL